MAKLLQNKALSQFIIVTFYAALSLLLTYPLVTHFSTHVLGTDIWAFDEYTFIWNMWWFKHSLIDLHSSPLFSDYIFYPLGISLVLYTYNLFNALMSLPLQPFLPLPAIANLMSVFALTLSGYGTYLLLRYLLRVGRDPPNGTAPPRECAAFIGGLVYAFSSYHFVYAALGHNELVTTQWLPLYVLFLTKSLDERRWLNAVLAGVFAALAMLCDMLFGVFLAFLTLVVLGFAGRRRVASLGFAKRLGVLLVTFLVLYGAVAYPIVREFLRGEYAMEGWGHSDKLLVDLFGFTTPTALHPIFGGGWTQELIAVREGTARFVDVNTVFVGWVVLVLALFASVRYWGRLKAWTLGALASAVLAMGPLLYINGRSTFDLDGLLVNVPLPFIVLHYIPFVNANRVPHRFSAVLMLCLAVLVGFAANAIVQRLKGGAAVVGVSAALSALFLFEHLSVPMPLTDARVPAWYNTLAQEPGDFSILEFPLGWRNSFGVFGVERTQAQYYQTTHQKRLPSGNISRNPPFKFEYFRRLPIFDSIAKVELYEELDPSRVEQDRLLAEDLVYFFDIRYLVFQPIVPNSPPYCDTRPQVEEYAQQVFPVERVYRDESGFTVYKVQQPTARTELNVDFGTEGARLYQGEGWSRDEVIGNATANWSEARVARLFLPLRHLADYQLSFRALAFSYEGAPQQTISVAVNGHELPEVLSIGPYWEERTITLQAAYLKAGLNELVLKFAYSASPRDVLPGRFGIGDTGVTSPVEITVNSAGALAGDFAYITVNGQDASTHRRGYNLAVIDPETGAVVKRAGFDTWANEYEAQDLADFVADVPEGYIVAVAVKDDGAANLTQAAVEALGSLGAEIDLRGTEHLSHAIIGVRGGTPGTALEASAEGNSYLYVGRNPDDRTLSVALDYVNIQEQ
ncbi:MAG TPA: interleukin-like EMT inducer domain-containing protein [Anaerolineae bacterium]|nr:interleukin-like EMT inducer domain-containing protein [Anaerolineae bacterium]